MISSNMSFLLISVLLPEGSGAEVAMTAGVGAMVMAGAPAGSVAAAAWEFLKKLNFIVKD